LKLCADVAVRETFQAVLPAHNALKQCDVGADFIMGAIRVTLLVPRLGERIEELIKMPFMRVVIVSAASFITQRFALPAITLVHLSTGVVALAMMIAAELLLAVALQDRALGQSANSRDPISDSVCLAILILFAVMPLLISRLRFGQATQGGLRS